MKFAKICACLLLLGLGAVACSSHAPRGASARSDLAGVSTGSGQGPGSQADYPQALSAPGAF